MDDQTKLRILAELDAYIPQYAPIQDGDLTARDIAESKGITERSAGHWIEKIAKQDPDKWERVKVWGEFHWLWVLRRKEAGRD